MELEFYAKASSRKSAIDQSVDNVQNVLLSNFSTLRLQHIGLDMDEPFTQTDQGVEIFNNEKYNYAAVEINLRML